MDGCYAIFKFVMQLNATLECAGYGLLKLLEKIVKGEGKSLTNDKNMVRLD